MIKKKKKEKQNPFNENINNDDEKKELDNDEIIYADEETKKRKEKILQTIQDINISRRNYLNENGILENNENNKGKNMIIYRCEIESMQSPKLNYSIAIKRDIINYSKEIIIYNAKLKLLSQIKGQKVPMDKSSPWNYQINLGYIIRKEKEEQRKLYNQIIPKEKDIKNSENNFQHLSLINENYIPAFLTNLKTEGKLQFNKYIKDKLRVIDLSSVKKDILQAEKDELNKYIEKRKFPNKNKKILTLIDNEKEQKEMNKKKFKLKLIEELNILKEKNNEKILNKRKFNKGINKTEEKLVFNTIDNSPRNCFSNRFNIKEKKLYINRSSKLIPFPKSDFNDVRFLQCKNEFDEKINEMANPLKLICEKNPKLFKLPKLNTNY